MVWPLFFYQVTNQVKVNLFFIYSKNDINMIQINDNSDKVVINFPRNNRNFTPTLLKLKSVLLNVENSYAIDAEVNGDYFTFEINLSDLENGEFKALITDGNQDNNTYDIIRIGEIKSNSKSNNSKITYKAYGK